MRKPLGLFTYIKKFKLNYYKLHTRLSASLTSPISRPDASPILVPRKRFPTITAPGPGSKTQQVN